MERLKWPVVALALAAPVVTAWLLQSRSLPASSAAPAHVAGGVPAGPRVIGSGIGDALAAYGEVLGAIRGMEAPAVMPQPSSHSAGRGDLAVKIEAPELALPPGPKVDDKDKIALFFTGSCIGETDPCG